MTMIEVYLFLSVTLNLTLGIGYYVNIGTIDKQNRLIEDMMRQMGVIK